jgi:endonuclease G, mitochondrial
MPAADQVMFNRHYVLGYSYYFRQAKWALEIVDRSLAAVARSDSFRPDYRIPELFRADLVDYKLSGFERGHLIASANQRNESLQNSETFLLSNMSPMTPSFNRGIWGKLEDEVRRLDAQPKILETYVLTGPVFYFDKAVMCIGVDDDNEVSVPVPHAFFKCVLAENNRGTIRMWSFVMPNKDCSGKLSDYRVSSAWVEQIAGLKLWERLVGRKIEREKARKRALW